VEIRRGGQEEEGESSGGENESANGCEVRRHEMRGFRPLFLAFAGNSEKR
jgi:hypothetical protein